MALWMFLKLAPVAPGMLQGEEVRDSRSMTTIDPQGPPSSQWFTSSADLNP
ncbi:hypothetical protein GMORB2_5111 [Geosmithia morbida]|uniref:Uncharacterized protein n=1 Tax=Geosmithia morbida TaxID=1094350 RepID=A0A9P5D656_9HYPO|nr:uncharacterized protein GMORB2_5111 [Geosmithia morbida]KAF4124445.1 hypothetical protein GMORB2_5111 [Geosmithia morbida]